MKIYSWLWFRARRSRKKLIKTCVVDTIGPDAKLPLLVCDTVASRHCLVFRMELYHRQSFHVFALVEYCHYYLVSDIYELRPMHKRHVHALLPVGPMPKFQRAVRRLSGHISDRVMHVVRLPVYFFNNKKLWFVVMMVWGVIKLPAFDLSLIHVQVQPFCTLSLLVGVAWNYPWVPVVYQQS